MNSREVIDKVTDGIRKWELTQVFEAAELIFFSWYFLLLSSTHTFFLFYPTTSELTVEEKKMYCE